MKIRLLIISFLSLATASFCQQGNWKSVGPSSWTTASSKMAASISPGIGKTSAIAISKTDSNKIYLGSPDGGLWKSIDGGNTWIPKTDFMAKYGVTFVAVDPVNDDKVYMLTSAGLFKTTDGGDSWMQMTYQDTLRGMKIMISPVNSQVLFIACVYGIVRSTDGGNTWSVINNSICSDLEFKPGNAAVVYAAVYTDPGYDLLRSTNGGLSFDTITPPGNTLQLMELAVTDADSNYLYVLSYDNVLLSTDGGNSFLIQPSSSLLPSNTFNEMHHFEVSPADKNFIFFAGTSIVKSTDAGYSWTVVTHYTYDIKPFVHPDNRFIYFYGSSFWSCNDGGVNKTEDYGITWIDKSAGLAITQVGDLSVCEANNNVFGIGCADNGTIIHYGDKWVNIYGGDGQNMAIDPVDSLHVLMTTQYGGMYETVNGGDTVTRLGESYAENPYGFNYEYTIRFNPQNRHTIFRLIQNVFRSVDDGRTFTKISNFASYGGGRLLYIHAADSNIIYTNYHLTTDGGQTWSLLTVPFGGNRGLAVDPKDYRRIWTMGSVANVNYSTPSTRIFVYYSSDAGSTWSQVNTSDLPVLKNIQKFALNYINNGHDGLLLCAGPVVYYLDDRLSNWQPFMQNLPLSDIYDVNIHQASKKIRLLSYGRGVWESSTPYDSAQALKADFISDKAFLCPTDTVHFFDNSINNGPGYHAVYSWSFPGGSPAVSTTANPVVVYDIQGVYPVTLKIVNDNATDSITQTSFITVEQPPLVSLPITEGFEGAAFPAYGWNWSHEKTPNPWFRQSYTGDGGYTQSKTRLAFVPTDTSDRDVYVSPVIDLSNITDPVMIFDLAYAFDSLKADTLKIFYTTDCGRSRNYIYASGGVNLSTLYVKPNYSVILTANSWKTDTLDLTSLKGVGLLQLGFEVSSYGACNMFFDNINLNSLTPLSVGERNKKSNGLKIFPNPADNYVEVQWKDNNKRPATLSLISMLGEIVFQKEIFPGEEVKIRTDQLAAGIYSVRCSSERCNDVVKMAIAR